MALAVSCELNFTIIKLVNALNSLKFRSSEIELSVEIWT